MFQSYRKEQPFPKITSLLNILQDNRPHLKEQQIQELFMVSKREIYQLDYLYNSPHFTQSPTFRDLVQLLERANQQAHRFNQSNSVVQKQQDPNMVKVACLKLIYREMLCIAVKSRQEIEESKIIEKIKDWYYSLTDMHSFLQGVNIKKKDRSKDQILEENRIRANYVSNVFDQIDDYFRRKIDYLPRKDLSEEEPKASKFKRPQPKSSCNLPLIDKAIYKREDQRMREHRQKQFEKFYLTTMTNNKNRMKQAGLVKFRSKYNQPKQNIQKKIGEQQSLGFMTIPENMWRGSQNVSPKRETSWKAYWLVEGKLRQNKNNTRLSLSNINGINLLHNRYE